MFKFCSLFSGSTGNSLFIETENSKILVDAGESAKKIVSALSLINVSVNDIDAILVTHEHIDHIAGLGVLSRRYGIPIYTTEKTADAIQETKSVGKIPEELFHPVCAEEAFTIKDLTVNPMRISHDAADPVGYRFSYGSSHAAVCTDLGTYNDYTVECLKGMDVLLLEANHDVNMLQVGSYPYYLKQRILGNRGHLSNENSGRLLSRVLHDNLKKVILGHLSQENNLPELAYETVRMEIDLADNPYHGGDFPIQVAKRNEVSEMICF